MGASRKIERALIYCRERQGAAVIQGCWVFGVGASCLPRSGAGIRVGGSIFLALGLVTLTVLHAVTLLSPFLYHVGMLDCFMVSFRCSVQEFTSSSRRRNHQRLSSRPVPHADEQSELEDCSALRPTFQYAWPGVLGRMIAQCSKSVEVRTDNFTCRKSWLRTLCNQWKTCMAEFGEGVASLLRHSLRLWPFPASSPGACLYMHLLITLTQAIASPTLLPLGPTVPPVARPELGVV